MTAQRTAEKAYTVNEAAEIKGVSPDTIKRAIRAAEGNTLAAKMIGRGYRIKASDLDAWFDGLESA